MFDLEKAKVCTGKIKDYFNSIEEIANVEIPNNIKLGTNKQILYIFYSCLLDYGMRSKIYHSNLINTYKKYKEIFNPSYVVKTFKNNKEKLLNIIKENIHPRYPNIALKKWLKLSEFLDTNYPNDKLIQKIVSLQSYKGLYNFITNIKGFGQKTGGLLLRLIFESGICHFNDELQYIPIDRHDVEISYLNVVIDKQSLNNEELKMLGNVWINAAKENNISACDIDKYLWIIGNNLCKKKNNVFNVQLKKNEQKKYRSDVMIKENNVKDNILKSKFFLKLFGIPAVIWIFLSLISMINQSDSKYMAWVKSIISNLIIIGIWFGISFIITKHHQIKKEKNIKMGRTLEKKWEEISTFKKIRFPLIMSIITFLVGIFLSYDLVGFPLKVQVISFLAAFIPFILFMIFLFVIYINKEKQKVFSIFKTISIAVTCLLLFYYFIAMFIIILVEAVNPMTNPKYYSFHIPDSQVFPKNIPKDVEEVKFLYAPGVLQSGTRYTLYYVDKNMTLNEFDKKYNKQAKWIGHIDDYKEKAGLLSGAFYYTSSKYKNENDYVIYLITSRCDGPGYCNHGHFLMAAFNEKTNQVVYSTETW